MVRFTSCSLTLGSILASIYVFAATGCGGTSAADVNKISNAGGTGAGARAGLGGNHPVGTGGSTPIDINVDRCGDGKLDDGEYCDDGNLFGGDGCTELCQIEADWECLVPGQPCTYSAVCGDGKLASVEACDDFNTVGGDGCSADCRMVEDGWQCRVPGKHCVAFCGDGKIMAGAENCDDNNAVSGDGCSSTCLTEPGYDCSSGVCVASDCGNGVVEVGESCDLGAANGHFNGDATGCSKTCTQEPNCRAGGVTQACETRCGDGNIDPGEQCDDANGVDGDGCSALCTVETGFDCNPAERVDTEPCSTGAGECLLIPITYRDFDGAQAPNGHPDFFNYGAAGTVCVPNASGMPDDTTWAGSNCASTDSTDLCPGLVAGTLGADGKPTTGATNTCACRFTDWDETGVIGSAAGSSTCTNAGDGSQRTRIETAVQVIQSPDSFNDWYHDTGAGVRVDDVLELEAIGGNQFQFSSSDGRTVYDDLHDICLATPANSPSRNGSLTSGFFPLESSSGTKVCNIWPYWVAGLATNCCAGEGCPVYTQWDPLASYDNCPTTSTDGGPIPSRAWDTGAGVVEGELRNFYFTSEARYLFHYDGGTQELSFFGDDDVWVFVNGVLVLDLGAPHERLEGVVTMDGTTASYVIQARDLASGSPSPVDDPHGTGSVPVTLEPGNTYEIAVFHADRHPRESNYQLTLFGFSTTQSECMPTCGDGVVAMGEECDCGTDPAALPPECVAPNQNDVYNGCTLDCKFGPFCGDGIVSEGETCDLGRDNGTPYGETGCTALCQPSHFCGDGITDAEFGEVCDLGTNNGGAGQPCTLTCQKLVQ